MYWDGFGGPQVVQTAICHGPNIVGGHGPGMLVDTVLNKISQDPETKERGRQLHHYIKKFMKGIYIQGASEQQ